MNKTKIKIQNHYFQNIENEMSGRKLKILKIRLNKSKLEKINTKIKTLSKNEITKIYEPEIKLKHRIRET